MNKIIPWVVTGGAVLVLAVFVGGYFLISTEKSAPISIISGAKNTSAISTASTTIVSNFSPATTTLPDKFADWKTYSDTKHGFQFKYPPSNTTWYNSYSDTWFQVLIDKTPSDSIGEIYGEQDGSGCHDGLCDIAGSEELYGNNKWSHLHKPFLCPSESCPTGEVYKVSNGGWTYYLEIQTTEDAKKILSTFQFI